MLANEQDYVFRQRYPERGAIYVRFDVASADLRRQTKGLLDLPYGDHPRCRFDLFPGEAHAPLVVFIHGGYWQSLSKDRYSFVAAPFLKQGMSVALLGYPLSPDATIAEIQTHILSGLDAIFEALDAEERRPRVWAITGHSAGGHLAACAARLWKGPLPKLCGLVPISGLFDLEPLIETSVNETLGLDRDTAKALSPLFHNPTDVPLTAVVGAAETSGFLIQTERFLDRHRRAGRNDVRLVLLPEANHYSILLDFLQPHSIIAEAVAELCYRR